MKSALLISIHPEYVDKILSGQKRFEFRKRIPISNVSHLVIYATTPIQKIVAVAEVESVISQPPSALWEKTKYAAGISRDYFRVYFRGCDIGHAFKMGKVFRIDTTTASQFDFIAPQSFAYLPQDSFKTLLHSLEKKPSVDCATIFIAGIHGVGKTFFSTNYLAPYGWNCYSASTIIKSYKGDVNTNKLTSNISTNQEKLIEGIKQIKKTKCDISIDGHFTLLNSCSIIESVSLDTFQKMKLNGIIILRTPEKVIAERLMKRDKTLWSLLFLKEFQKREKNEAISFAENHHIPYIVIDSLWNTRKISKVLSTFYQAIRKCTNNDIH